VNLATVAGIAMMTTCATLQGQAILGAPDLLVTGLSRSRCKH